MRYAEVGGAKLSVIGLGTWQFGSTEWGYGRDYNRRVAGDIVQRALDLGITLIDTAEVYGFGRSERIVGNAIGPRRESVFLASKLFPVGLPFMIRGRARASARRLGVAQVDLYQQHWPSPLFSPATTMPHFRRLVDEGLVRHVGVSNHSLAAWQLCESAFGGRVLSNQVRFSLAHRGPERDLLPWAQREGRIVIAYSPLGQGLLSGKYQSSPPRNFRRFGADFGSQARARREPLISALRDVAGRHRATAAQIALAWLIQKPNVVAIPGASSVQQVEENAAAADIRLADEEIARLDGFGA